MAIIKCIVYTKPKQNPINSFELRSEEIDLWICYEFNLDPHPPWPSPIAFLKRQ